MAITIYIWKGLPAEEDYLARLEEKMHYEIDKMIAHFVASVSQASRPCEYWRRQTQASCEEKARAISLAIRDQYGAKVDELQFAFDHTRKATKEELMAAFRSALLQVVETQDKFKDWRCP